MYIKEIKKKNTPNGKVFKQYQLAETYRIGKKVKQNLILYLAYNKILENKLNRDIVAKLLENKIKNDQVLSDDFLNASSELQHLAEHYYKKYVQKKFDEEKNEKKEIKKDSTEYHEVDLDFLGIFNCREIGAEWMCYQMLARFGLKEFLQHKGWSEKEIDKGIISIISRAVGRYSENKTESWLSSNSGLLELFGKRIDSVSRYELYSSAADLYGIKDDLEAFFYNKANALFQLKDSILIYDLTNTYFEGRKLYSKLAKYGHNKEKRYDCKQVVLAAVVNSSGFLKHSNIYSGNMSNPETLKDIIIKMKGESIVKEKQQLIVIDAGIATEDNLEMLRTEGFLYVVVSRSKPKKSYSVDTTDTVKVTDRKGEEIELKFMNTAGSLDRWVYVKSKAKTMKEDSMLLKAIENFEKEMEGVKQGISKKGGTKKAEKVWERIGRVKERNKSVNKYYDINVDVENGIAVNVEYIKKELKPESKQSGEYYLRTSYTFSSEVEVWEVYNTIREVESTFRCLKTDLHLRPVFHQQYENCEAHLHLGLLSYQIVSAIRYMLKEAGIHYGWDNIVRIMNTQKAVSVTVKDKGNDDIIVRKCSRPDQEVLEIYRTLKMSSMPFVARKFVVSH